MLQTQTDFDLEALNNTAASGEEGESLRGDIFTITYWFFYPFKRGKRVCTSNIPLLGWILFPRFDGRCLAREVVMEDHVGDWEHLSINFQVDEEMVDTPLTRDPMTAGHYIISYAQHRPEE